MKLILFGTVELDLDKNQCFGVHQLKILIAFIRKFESFH
jgi:hypothetical protein